MTSRTLLPLLLPLVLLPLSCSESKDPADSNGGTPGAGTGGTGAAPGAGGSAQAGSGATGGSAPSTGGTGTTAGTGGSGTGGSGNAAGSGGSGAMGGSGATGGTESMAGSGGVAGMSGSGGTAGTGDAGSSPGGMAGSSGGGNVECPTESETTFSFFMPSQRALAMDSGNPDGYGGDLGGITGADEICRRIASSVSPCQAGKVWRAFLSTSTEDAIDRIGDGPWYDRLGRLFGNNVSDITSEDRPIGDEFFLTDVSTEDGSPSINPNGTGNENNHQTLTGTGVDGRLYTQDAEAGREGRPDSCGGETEWTVEKATCWDWTSSEEAGCPRVGHSWPRQGSGINWMSVWNEGGCAPGGVILDEGGLDGTRRVGSGGGYGGFYCFAILPD